MTPDCCRNRSEHRVTAVHRCEFVLPRTLSVGRVDFDDDLRSIDCAQHAERSNRQVDRNQCAVGIRGDGDALTSHPPESHVCCTDAIRAKNGFIEWIATADSHDDAFA